LILCAELFQVLLLLRLGKLAGLRLQGEHWLFIGILGGLAPTLHLLRKQSSLSAVGTEVCGVQASRLHHHRELVGSATALWFLPEAGTTAPCNRQTFLQLKRVTTWMPSSAEI